MYRLVRLLQSAREELARVVTLLGRVRLVRPEPEKSSYPMLVMPSGRVTPVREEQAANVSRGMEVKFLAEGHISQAATPIKHALPQRDDTDRQDHLLQGTAGAKGLPPDGGDSAGYGNTSVTVSSARVMVPVVASK